MACYYDVYAYNQSEWIGGVANLFQSHLLKACNDLFL